MDGFHPNKHCLPGDKANRRFRIARTITLASSIRNSPLAAALPRAIASLGATRLCLRDCAAFKVGIHKALWNEFHRRVGQAAAKTRRPTIGGASIGGPALAFARWSHPTFCLCLSLSLCLTSGCAMTRTAWKSVHTATCGEPASQCHCSCDACNVDGHMETEFVDQTPRTQSSSVASPVFPLTPQPPEGSRPIAHGVQSQPATMNGMPGTWIPAPHPSTDFGFENQTQMPPQNQSPNWATEAPYAASPAPPMHIPPQTMQWPVTQAPASCPPDSPPEPDALKEYRTQVQVLSEQISQMKDAQDSMKSSQQTLQESHTREILELKLQQATGDRDRIQRERELEQQLEKQRQRELETIDSLSQIIEGVIPGTPASSAAPVPAPRSAAPPRQAQSITPQTLPTVDENH